MLEKAKQLVNDLEAGSINALARILTIVENDLKGAEDILKAIRPQAIPVIGITGPPGAGKSTLVNALINEYVKENKKIAVLAVDPSSPFNQGSLLGDRIRMKDQFNRSNIFIRSLASRGALGGLSIKTIEMADVLKSADFDYIFIETVGVGQSEIEIAGLADLTIVVLVPEGGDEIQHIKSGLMEIADVFVLNKADRPDAVSFANGLSKLIKQNNQNTAVIKTVADKGLGITDLVKVIHTHPQKDKERKLLLLTEKAWQLIQYDRMKDIKKERLQKELSAAIQGEDFNLYRFIDKFKRS